MEPKPCTNSMQHMHKVIVAYITFYNIIFICESKSSATEERFINEEL